MPTLVTNIAELLCAATRSRLSHHRAIGSALTLSHHSRRNSAIQILSGHRIVLQLRSVLGILPAVQPRCEYLVLRSSIQGLELNFLLRGQGVEKLLRW